MPPDDSMSLFPPEQLDSADARGKASAHAPLAERMRPQTLDEVLGQDHLLGAGAALRSLSESDALPSLILWGPPGCGKTTLARLLALHAGAHFEPLSAVMAGVKEIRDVVQRARRIERRTVLFLDELHRLNRAQQDSLLPHVEAGTVTLIGATTENPSFEINAPLLSRCRVFTLSRLDADALAALTRRAALDEIRGLGKLGVAVEDDAVAAIAHAADGDARRALGLLEAATAVHLRTTQSGTTKAGRPLSLDRDREEHYNVVSALIKSLRASDPDAALYYAARMLDAGEDPLFVARRLVIFASEDVGNADPQALGIAMSAYLAVERIGMPEGRIPLGQAVPSAQCPDAPHEGDGLWPRLRVPPQYAGAARDRAEPTGRTRADGLLRAQPRRRGVRDRPPPGRLAPTAQRQEPVWRKKRIVKPKPVASCSRPL